MALITCPECGKKISDNAEKCVICGFPIHKQLHVKKKRCEYCGSMNSIYAETCFSCAAPLMVEPAMKEEPPVQQTSHVEETVFQNNVQAEVSYIPNAKRKNKWVGFFLCLFFGVFGAHKFYEGNIKKGILYLFTMGLFAIGWIYDCVSYVLKPEAIYDPDVKTEEEESKKWIAIVATIVIIWLIGLFSNTDTGKNGIEPTEMQTEQGIG